MGMAMRSARRPALDGILYADRGNPALGPLVIKASAGTVFRAPLLRCTDIAEAVAMLRKRLSRCTACRRGGDRCLFTTEPFAERALFVLGGESDGHQPALRDGWRRISPSPWRRAWNP
jgi:23S rRNA (guanosine2251-2'-O)-methyltransferase